MKSPVRIRENLTAPAERLQSQVVRSRGVRRSRTRLKWFWRKLLDIPFFNLLYRTAQEMGADDATHMAAGVAYYALLSLFPLIVGLISLFGLFLRTENLEGEVFGFFQTYLPGSKELLSANINAAGNIRGVLGIVSFLGLFWSASLLFGAISRAVNRAWDIHQDRPFYIDKVRHIIMALSVAPLFLLSISTTALLEIIHSHELPTVGRVEILEGQFIVVLTRVLPFFFTLAIFLLIYKFTPNTKTHWRFIWPGAILGAALFEICKSVFLFYLENFAHYEQVYGSLASVIALLAWTYLASIILILGAEFSSEYGRMRVGVARGQPIGDTSRRRETSSPRSKNPV